MRKSIFIIATLLISGIIIVISCSKEEVQSTNPEQIAQSDDNQQIINSIKDFKQKIAYYQENPGYKSGETISTDDALNLLEGTMNYSHAFSTDYYDEVLKENTTLIVPKTSSGEVDMDVLVQKYNEMKSDITTNYQNSSFENKGLIIVDLTETSQTSNEITMDVAMFTGERSNDPPTEGIGGPFGTGDDWWYGEDVGKCDGTIQYSDAAQELSAEMAKYIYHYNLNQGYIGFSWVQTVTLQGGTPYLRRPNDPNPPDNYIDYYLYNADSTYGTITNSVLCVENNEMNLYYSYLEYLLYTKLPDDILNSLRPVQIIDMQGIEDPSIDEHYYHWGQFQMGIPINYEDGEGPEEL
jgi:hypothetical protein